MTESRHIESHEQKDTPNQRLIDTADFILSKSGVRDRLEDEEIEARAMLLYAIIALHANPDRPFSVEVSLGKRLLFADFL